MAAALVAQVLKGVVAGDAEDDFLEAALLAGAEGDVLDLPALVAGIVRVHVVKVAGEQGRLVAAGAGADFHDEAVVSLALGQDEIFQPVLQRLLTASQIVQFLLGVLPHLRIGFRVEQRLGLGEIVADFLVFEIGFDALGERAVLLGGAA